MIAGNQRTVARGNSCVAEENRVVLGGSQNCIRLSLPSLAIPPADRLPYILLILPLPRCSLPDTFTTTQRSRFFFFSSLSNPSRVDFAVDHAPRE